MLFVFQALRARADIMILSESLEVGVRLGIRVAGNGTVGKTFFVNEITRLYWAHYFSHNMCAELKILILRAFAKAFHACIDSSMESLH